MPKAQDTPQVNCDSNLPKHPLFQFFLSRGGSAVGNRSRHHCGFCSALPCCWWGTQQTEAMILSLPTHALHPATRTLTALGTSESETGMEARQLSLLAFFWLMALRWCTHKASQHKTARYWATEYVFLFQSTPVPKGDLLWASNNGVVSDIKQILWSLIGGHFAVILKMFGLLLSQEHIFHLKDYLFIHC